MPLEDGARCGMGLQLSPGFPAACSPAPLQMPRFADCLAVPQSSPVCSAVAGLCSLQPLVCTVLV